MSFVSELKRRNVIRMAGLYLVGAWLLVQVAGTVLPIFHTPDWALQALVVLVVLGFAPALVFAWVFELTPEGLKRDADIAPEQSIAPQTARRMDRMIIAVLLLALVFFGFDRLVLSPRRDAALVASTTQAVTAKATKQDAPDLDRRSIAVLPFVNMSGDKDNEYFSDGISEEILNVLAAMPELRVAARTSSFSFRGSKQEVQEIAKALKVRMVLEGSVRKQGDRVRITAQLIDAGTGYHEWSQTYDRELKDIFAIQDEIARAIGEELKLRVASQAAAGPARQGAANPKAYDLYLRGLTQWQTRNVDDLWAARESFSGALAADPKFAPGWAGLALLYAVLPDYSSRITFEEAHSLGREAAERALLLDPTLPEPYAALGSIEKYQHHQQTAVALLERAIELRPSFVTAHQWLGTALVPMGEVEKGLGHLRRANELDPRSVIVASNYASMLLVAGRNAEAIAACKAALEYAPNSFLCTSVAGLAYLVDGDLASARIYYDLLAASWSPGSGTQVKTLFDALAGRSDRHAFALRLSQVTGDEWNDPAKDMPFAAGDIPPILVLLGENELVFEFLSRQPPGAVSGLSWAMLLPAMDPVRCDPRFTGLLAKSGLKDLRAAKICQGKR